MSVPRAIKWGVFTLTFLFVAVAAALLLLNRWNPGQRAVLDYAVGRLERSIEGTVEVRGVRSGSLLTGATLYDIDVRDDLGRPFLAIDSVEVGYGWTSLLRGDVVLSKLYVHGAHLTLSRYPGEETFNLDRIFRVTGRDTLPRADSARARNVAFDDIELVDAFVEILLPVDPADPPPERAITTTIPGVEGSFQRIYFESIQAELDSAIISPPSAGGPRVTVESLSMIGHLYKDPFTLTQLEGDIAWREGKLTVAAEDLRLPDTRTSGVIVADFTAEGRGGRDTGWAVTLALESPHYSLADLHWLVPKLPHGEGEGRFDISLTDLGQVDVGFSDATIVMDGSRAQGQGHILFDRGVLSYEGVRLSADDFALAQLEWLFGELPLRGTVTGDVALSGSAADLEVQGDVTLLEPERAPTRGTFSGTFHLGAQRGVTGLVADFSEVDYGLLSAFLPASRLGGTGHGHLEATGTLDGGVRYRVELVHDAPQLPSSELVAEGTLTKVGDDFTVDVDADVSPLSLTALQSYYPKLPFTGEVMGKIRATGPLSDLSVTTDLDTPAGQLDVEARFDVRDPGAFYRVEGDVGDFDLSRVSPELPEPSLLNGYIRLEGRGTDPKTATIDALVRTRGSRIWEVDVDSALVSVRVREGLLYVDSARALASGVHLSASGTLATSEDGPPGEIRVTFDAESLAGLRPVLMERNILVQDGLTEMQLEALRAQGVDTDTLPTTEEVMVGGRASGSATLTGSLQRFSATGSATLGEVRYGRHLMRNAEVTFTAAGLPDFGRDLHARVLADSLELFGRTFRALDAEVDFARPGGAVQVALVRDDSEDYHASARFELDSLSGGGSAELQTLTLRLDTLGWRLERSAGITWDDQVIRVEDAKLVQTGGGVAQVSASGVIPREGEADFGVNVQGLDLAQVVGLLQLEEAVSLDGRLDVDFRVHGTAEMPLIVGTMDATDVHYQGYSMQRVAGDVQYGERRLGLNLAAWQNDLRVLRMSGQIPALLSLNGAAVSFPDEQIDLIVEADSLPAAFVAGVFRDMVDVQGTVAGRFLIGGTLDNPAPTGSLDLQNAAWTLESVGVRHENVRGTLTLRPDGTVEVDATANADGTARMTGSVKLAPLRNPTFDLQVSFDNFRAVDRRDAVANVGGIIRLTGTFRAPLIEGLGPAEGLRVESGILYLEEVVRSATIVDLTDPRFREYVDSTLTQTRDVIAESQNPFLQNLRVEVDVAVAQDTWLRSSEMDVEIGGDLRVSYDRRTFNLQLAGVLDARRGQYTVLGRTFQVQEGTVEFRGGAGINPILNILAATRVRRQNTDQLTITARVTGTLTEPRVALGSEEAAIGESDLVSYLLFGQPSYELASTQRAQVGAATSFVGTFAVGTVASRLGSVIARFGGLDYFAITEVGSAWDLGSVTQSQLEFGQYLRQDLFLVLGFQPAQVSGSSLKDAVGVRVEYTPTQRYTLETFYEDRFSRSRVLGFQDVGLVRQKILGLSLFREWGF